MSTANKPKVIQPQPGPQTAALESSADIIIYGGQAGGGKSWFLLADPMRHLENSGFAAVIFRRTTPQIRKAGSLWDQSLRLYRHAGGEPTEHTLEWRFPSGARISFGQLEWESTIYDYDSSEIAFIGFDELTHFTEKQFWYLLTRNRTTCGVRPCIRAACNPDADSWVAELIAWWIDQDTGYAIPWRSGLIRWFVRRDEKLYWSDHREELVRRFPGSRPKSLTFIAAKLEDNQILERSNPDYRANLENQPLVERERLLFGNWKIRPTVGNVLRRDWFELVDAVPAQCRWCRYWDKAGSITDGDFSAGVLLGRAKNIYYVADVVHGRWSPMRRNEVIHQTAELDTKTYGNHKVELWLEREPGNGGKESAEISAVQLARFAPHFETPTENKQLRARPFAAQAEAGNVKVLKAAWTKDYIDELCEFPDGPHDDRVDGTSGAFNKLVKVRNASGSTSRPRTYPGYFGS